MIDIQDVNEMVIVLIIMVKSRLVYGSANKGARSLKMVNIKYFSKQYGKLNKISPLV